MLTGGGVADLVTRRSRDARPGNTEEKQQQHGEEFSVERSCGSDGGGGQEGRAGPGRITGGLRITACGFYTEKSQPVILMVRSGQGDTWCLSFVSCCVQELLCAVL